MLYIQAVLFCEFVRAIYVHNSGNPYEYLNPNSEGDEITINEAAEYSDVKIVNISSLAGQSDGQILTNKKRNRVGFYNVQTGDEFFLNDFEDITTTTKPNTPDNPRVNIQQRPQQHTNNRRKNNNKVTNNRRKPAVQNTKKPTNNKRPTINRNKNNQQTNKRRPQQTQHFGQNNNGCRNPNLNNKRPQISNNNNNHNNNNNKKKKNTVIRPQNHNKPVRKVTNNKRQTVKNKNRNRVKNNRTKLDPNNISVVIKKYISKLKSKSFDNSVERSARSLNARQRSLFTTALNQIRNQSMNLANQFLSFFTVMQYPNYQCIADSDFNYYEGVCYQEKQCLKLGGTPLGNCSSYDACCVFKSTCGESTNQNCTYFESPNYPKYFPDQLEDPFYDDDDEGGGGGGGGEGGEEEEEIPFEEVDLPLTTTPPQSVGVDEFFVETDSLSDIPLVIGEDATTEESFIEDFDLTENVNRFQPNRYKEYPIRRSRENLAENFACSFKIFKTSEGVQQMKIEFIDLELLGPDPNGDCLNERLMISGQNLNAHVPIICGYNSGQHVYIDVGTLTGPLQISILSNDIYTKRYKFRVCQLETPCVNSLNCLQYYSGTEGVISSFNYDQAIRFPRSDAQYLNNLNYAICIRREIGYCSTTFTNVDEEDVEYPFEIINQTNDTDEFSVGPEGCPHDYIVINNMRICGRSFKPITEEGSGPIIILPFHSNKRSIGVGFKLVYTQNKCVN